MGVSGLEIAGRTAGNYPALRQPANRLGTKVGSE